MFGQPTSLDEPHSLPSIRMRIIICTLGDESREKSWESNNTGKSQMGKWEMLRMQYRWYSTVWRAGLTPKQWHKNQEEPLWLKSLGLNDLCLHVLEESEEEITLSDIIFSNSISTGRSWWNLSHKGSISKSIIHMIAFWILNKLNSWLP